MTTIEQIHADIVRQLPDVVLRAETFGQNPVLIPLLLKYFSDTDGQISISGVQAADYSFDPAKGVIQFSGTGVDGPFGGMVIRQTVITVEDGTPRITIEAHAADGWVLPHAFPDLHAPILSQLRLQQAKLYWASFDDDDNTLGFYLSAILDFDNPPLSFLKLVVPNLKSPELWGDIQMQGSTTPSVVQYVPDMVLDVDSAKGETTIGPFTLFDSRFRIFANPMFNWFSRTWQTDSMIELATSVAFLNSSFRFRVKIRDVGKNLVLEAVIGQSIRAALAEIVQLVGGVSLDVPGFALLFPNDLELQGVSLGVNLTRSRILNFISLHVGTADGERWGLWGDVYLQNIKIVFLLTPAAQGYTVGGEISGQVGDWLGLRAAFASDGTYVFHGNLIKDQSIKDIYTFFSGSTLDDLPDLAVTILYLTLVRTAGKPDVSYTGELVLDGSWTIVTAPIEISLDGLMFRASHEAEGPTQFEVSAVLGIGDLSVGVRGAYQTAEGWTLEGRVSADPEPMALSDAAQQIDKGFPIQGAANPSIPPFLTGWYLYELQARFTTKKKDFDLGLEIGNTAFPWLQLNFGVHLTHGDTTYTKAFDAQAKITAAAFEMDFRAAIQEVSAAGPPVSTTFTLSATYTSAKPPRLSNLLSWVSEVSGSGVNLPAEIGIDAQVDDFALELVQKDTRPLEVQAAGAFSVTAGGSTWNLYFAYTNAVSLKLEDGAPFTVNGQPAYVFGAALGRLLDLSKLPLVGGMPGVGRLRIDKLGFYYTNAPLEPGQMLYFEVPGIGDPGKLAPQPAEASLSRSGFSLMAILGEEAGATEHISSAGTLRLPLDSGKPVSGQGPAFSAGQSIPQDPVYWLEVNRTFGPFGLEKIGLSYGRASDPSRQLGAVYFDLDGTFQISSFVMVLDRLGIGFDVPNPASGVEFNPMRDIRFQLGGIFVDYRAPDFQISGGFLSVPGPGVNFVGEFTILAGMYGLQAYGGFSDQSGQPSLFLFLHLEAPLGGPPFFFINGLAGGFGVNREFRLPSFAELPDYPFLPSSNAIPRPSQLGSDPKQQLDVMTQSLTNLARYVPVREGEYWLAVGVDVTSFEMIQVSAVLSVAFGVKFQVGLVGAATMTLPVNEPQPIAFIQIDFEVSFSPSDGLLAAYGKITPASFIYARLVHISGGFAFLTWFGGPNSGNYVMTVGGYNPQYRKPAIYPDVPRLQASFGIDGLNAQGEAYFALVPHAMMAGLAIHATWSRGPIDAWFDAGLDFLLNWGPFHYQADGYIAIGVSASIDLLFGTIHITVHVGVELQVWGPSFGGRAVIDLDVISFAIRFGPGPKQEQIDWNGFQAFLPSVNANPAPESSTLKDDSEKALVNITVAQGLLKTFQPGEDRDGLDWLIDPNGFQLMTESTAPCTDAAFNSLASLRALPDTRYLDPANLSAGVANAILQHEESPYIAYKSGSDGVSWTAVSVGILPLGLHNIQSTHSVQVQTVDAHGNPGAQVTDLIAVLEIKAYSQALWGNSSARSRILDSGNELIHDALSGLRIEPMLWFPKRTTFIPYYYLVFDTNDLFVLPETMPSFNRSTFNDPQTLFAAMESGDAFSRTQTARAGIVDLLRNVGFQNLALRGDGGLNTGQYTADPLLAYMSSTNEANLMS